MKEARRASSSSSSSSLSTGRWWIRGVVERNNYYLSRVYGGDAIKRGEIIIYGRHQTMTKCAHYFNLCLIATLQSHFATLSVRYQSEWFWNISVKFQNKRMWRWIGLSWPDEVLSSKRISEWCLSSINSVSSMANELGVACKLAPINFYPLYPNNPIQFSNRVKRWRRRKKKWPRLEG